MRLGFTGTRFGMAEQQRATVEALLRHLHPDELHEGDCIGADNQATNIMADLYGSDHVVCHPPLDAEHRAYNLRYREARLPLTHFARNRQIVTETQMLLAVPCVFHEEAKGGTWYTVRYARKMGRDVVIVWPDGKMLYEARSSSPETWREELYVDSIKWPNMFPVKVENHA